MSEKYSADLGMAISQGNLSGSIFNAMAQRHQETSSMNSEEVEAKIYTVLSTSSMVTRRRD